MSNQNPSKRPKSLSFKPPQASTALTSTTTTNVISFNNGHNIQDSTTVSSSSNSSSTSASPNIKTTSKKKNEFKLKRELTSSSIPGTGSSACSDDLASNQVEELNFLYLIYVPNKYLIKNNKKSIKNLIIHIPKIVPNNSQLNLCIHIFLSTIMVKFVNSWYLTKLNTSNLEFLKGLYDGLIVEFVKDVVGRLQKVNVLTLGDELVGILNDHIKLAESDPDKPFPYKFQNEFYEQCQELNNLIYDSNKSIREINIDYLSNSHIFFQNAPVNYYRILVRQVLLSSFQDSQDEGGVVNPFSSKIASDLVTLILGDLVVGNIVEKLSSLEFIFEKLNDILDLVLAEEEEEPPTTPVVVEQKPLTNRIKEWMYGTYHNFTKLVVLYHGKIKTASDESTTTDGFNIFDSSVFALAETIFNILERKPLLYNMVKTFKSLALMNSKLTSTINKVATRYLENKINENVTEERISKIINDLRVGLFYNDNQEKEAEKQEVTIDVLTEKLLKLNSKILSVIDLSYKNESQDDFRNSIKLVLILFQDKGEYLDKGMNKLLIIKLLDCIVGNLYDNI
ncbi:hypothetical protein Cantr_08331 [Candida viswanathii]|uniref:PXA domain-containing protein n=1 Tax=Candida viswanathii TaxID=5486 RepID=A0A367Y6Z4_9ASCO|nr:hypothetical protein Cantr_08331 [Candida viswanathii]